MKQFNMQLTIQYNICSTVLIKKLYAKERYYWNWDDNLKDPKIKLRNCKKTEIYLSLIRNMCLNIKKKRGMWEEKFILLASENPVMCKITFL